MKPSLNFVASSLLFLASLISPAAHAEPVPLKTGAAFKQALAAPAGIDWTAPPLRSALMNLSQAKQVAILLDRRVDPEQTVEFSSGDATLDVALQRLASRLKLGVCIFDSTVYLGPESVTHRLATVAAVAHDQTASAASDVRRKLIAQPALDIPPLATPRELLEQLANNTGLAIRDLDKVPHDLWPALRFPAQTAASRASLILAGFELALEFSADGTSARVVPLPEKITLRRSYAGGSDPKQRAAQIEKQFPRVTISPVGNQIQVEGSYEDHELIARLVRGEKIVRTEVRGGEQRYTLNVENQPVGAVAQALGSKLKMEVKFDPGTKEKLGALVSFKVDNVTLEALLKKMLDPAGMDFDLTENEIRIRMKK